MIDLLNNFSQKNILIVSIILMFIFFIVDSMIPLGVAGGVLYSVVILVSLWHENKKITVVAAISCTVLTIAGFYSSPAGGELWKVLFNRALALFAIWTIAVLSLKMKKNIKDKEEAITQREQAIADLKILKGFIPICSSCKKIKDEEGMWNQMEIYISKNSEADFSHGVCPDCLKTLYPDHISKIKDYF